MHVSSTLIVSITLTFGLVSGVAHAAPVSGQGTWETTLQGRDLDGNPSTFEAYYDTDLDITWLADVSTLIWGFSATDWAANLSLTDGVNTYDNWRLPTLIDTGTLGCNNGFNGTDCGYNVNTATSEMAHLFYDELGNKGTYDTAGAPQPGSGLTNTGPFNYLRGTAFWSGTAYAGTEYAPYVAMWYFSFGDGHQGYTSPKYYADILAVSPGDVAAVPEADTWAMLLAGLGLVGVAIGRRR